VSVSPVAPRITHRRVVKPPLWLIALTGEHDLSTSRDVERVLIEAVSTGDPVVVDLQPATLADSSILSANLTAAKQAGRRGLAVVLPADGEVSRLFEVVDAGALLVTFRTLQLAVEWCCPQPDGSLDGRGAAP
jgi:anti-anti-sigma regulatory factor